MNTKPVEEDKEASSVGSNSSFMKSLNPREKIRAEVEDSFPFYSIPTFDLSPDWSKQVEIIKTRFDIDGDFSKGAKGGFGTVFVVKEDAPNKDEGERKRYAIKMTAAKNFGQTSLKSWYTSTKRELYYLTKFRHPNIMKIYDHLWLTNDKCAPSACYLAMKTECLEMDLSTMLKAGPLNCKQQCQLLTEIGSALHCMHQHGVVHHDVSTRNIMIRLTPGTETSLTFVLIDFGMVKRYLEAIGMAREYEFKSGTAKYRCLEKTRCGPHDPYEPFKADCFALGAVTLRCMYASEEFPQHASPRNYRFLINDMMASLDQPQTIHRVVQLLLLPEHDRIHIEQALRMMQ